MSDPGLIVDDGQGELVIEGFSFTTPGWWTLDLSPLWSPADLRGANVVMPGASGRRALPRRGDETVQHLPMWITGAVDGDGAPHGDPVMGLAINIDTILEAIAPPAPPGATLSAVLTMPDMSTRSAEVQASLELGALTGPYDKPAVLTLVIPAGRFVEVGS